MAGLLQAWLMQKMQDKSEEKMLEKRLGAQKDLAKTESELQLQNAKSLREFDKSVKDKDEAKAIGDAETMRLRNSESWDIFPNPVTTIEEAKAINQFVQDKTKNFSSQKNLSVEGEIAAKNYDLLTPKVVGRQDLLNKSEQDNALNMHYTTKGVRPTPDIVGANAATFLSGLMTQQAKDTLAGQQANAGLRTIPDQMEQERLQNAARTLLMQKQAASASYVPIGSNTLQLGVNNQPLSIWRAPVMNSLGMELGKPGPITPTDIPGGQLEADARIRLLEEQLRRQRQKEALMKTGLRTQ